MTSKIIPVTEFIRNFGTYADLLLKTNKIILTREGRPFAEIKATPDEKNRELLRLRNSWDGKLFENAKVWKKVLMRRNRKKPIVI